ncbi:MAG: T9SS type A sorting domain-containing protein [Ignavibacteria bacterium]|jgi:Leucine-rich repeat (LRR) protein|nr:T9SS type A sorting domain-containing protein [Ignavibacteria bacterium]MCU7502883.1 T9SS type A sorting domain-containing protein [Ignavibacteria bacterium]MCU7515623.1 T9SS type A sorting domain-containing protein [Ignavibacteria bacterium]
MKINWLRNLVLVAAFQCIFLQTTFAQLSLNEDDVQFIRDLCAANSLYGEAPGSIGYQKWNYFTGRLEKLIVSNYDLENIPETIENLTALHYLDLSYNKITFLPVNFYKLTNLDTLILNNNAVKSLDDEITAFSGLQFLSLSGNRLTALPKKFVYLNSLSYLDLSANGLQRLPADTLFCIPGFGSDIKFFNRLGKLKYLNLAGNIIKEIKEEDLDGLPLTELYLDNNRSLYKLPNSTGSLSRLETLSLTYDSLLSLPGTLGGLKKLNLLNLEKNYLKTLPEGLFSLKTSLKTLILADNNFEVLPGGITSLKGLKSLNVSKNALKTLPINMWQMDSLESFNASVNKISSLPDDIGLMPQLKMLDLSSNSLSLLPSAFGSFPSIESVFLYGNSLTSIPGSIGNLHTLKEIYLNDNPLETLPETFGQIGTQLRVIALQNCELTRLPQNYGNLKGIVVQNLENNKLVELPESFCNLPEIRVLSLKNNKLARLPENFGKMRLVNITLSYNELTDLPESFSGLDSLANLTLDNNKFTSMPLVLTKLKNPVATINISDNFLKTIPDTMKSLKVVNLEVTNNYLYCEDDGMQNPDEIPLFLLHPNPFPVAVTGLFHQHCQTPNDMIKKGAYALYEPYPNPFNPSTTLHFSIPKEGYVEIGLYDVTGRKVEDILKGLMTKGYHKLSWGRKYLPSGTYFVMMRCGSFTQAQKIMILK